MRPSARSTSISADTRGSALPLGLWSKRCCQLAKTASVPGGAMQRIVSTSPRSRADARRPRRRARVRAKRSSFFATLMPISGPSSASGFATLRRSRLLPSPMSPCCFRSRFRKSIVFRATCAPRIGASSRPPKRRFRARRRGDVRAPATPPRLRDDLRSFMALPVSMDRCEPFFSDSDDPADSARARNLGDALGDFFAPPFVDRPAPARAKAPRVAPESFAKRPRTPMRFRRCRWRADARDASSACAKDDSPPSSSSNLA
mmetsp:Transcript_12941/g.44183  ORF Transcript_12941/g.44183 Transcript_12941/m.44183 type:complete len:260 (-) Transcript_12941:2122-2901(-)